jgi:hypothetical protein
MDLEQFLSQSSDSFSAVFNSRYCNAEDLLVQARELARLGLKVFPVGLGAKLNGCPDRLIADATDDFSVLEELTAAAQPLWGYRLAIGLSGLCVLVLDGALGRASFAALVPDLEECLTLQARCGDKVYAFFREPTATTRIALARKLAPGVSILGDGAGIDLPPNGGAAWVNPGAGIETLPYALLALLASDLPDGPPGRAMPAPKSPSPVPCRSTVYIPQPAKAPRKVHPVCGRADWRGGYRISRRR